MSKRAIFALKAKNTPVLEKVALVTGGSGGIGFETSVLLARNGFNTYSAVRNTAKSQSLNNIAKKDDLRAISRSIS
ncbi:MAG: SDR family NAD(P)-dependent oxidoreductase [Candidatus Nitrosopolaris sp.]